MMAATQPIRVLHVTNLLADNYYFKNLCSYVDRSAVRQAVVTLGPRGAFTGGLDELGVTTFGLQAGDRRQVGAALRRLGRVMAAENPDVVHLHLRDPSLVGAAVAVAQSRAIVVTRHHSDAHHVLASPLRRAIHVGLDRWLTRAAAAVIAPSRGVRDVLVARERAPADKVSIVPYPQTADRFDGMSPAQVAAARRVFDRGRLALVCVSRLYHRKAHLDLFAALAPLVRDGLDVGLYLVGEGPFRPVLEERVRALGLDRAVRFLGWRDDVLALLAAADLVVHPSLEDALSSALIESLMLGRPIVATDISGARDTLRGGMYGTIVPPSDPVAFGQAIADVLGDLDRARRRASGGRAYLLEYMGAARVAEQYREIYATVVAARRGRVYAG